MGTNRAPLRSCCTVRRVYVPVQGGSAAAQGRARYSTTVPFGTSRSSSNPTRPLMPNRPSSGGRSPGRTTACRLGTTAVPNCSTGITARLARTGPPNPVTGTSARLSNGTPSRFAAVRLSRVMSAPVSSTSVAGRPLISAVTVGTCPTSRTGSSATACKAQPRSAVPAQAASRSSRINAFMARP